MINRKVKKKTSCMKVKESKVLCKPKWIIRIAIIWGWSSETMVLYAPNISRQRKDSCTHVLRFLRFLNGNWYKKTAWQIQTTSSNNRMFYRIGALEKFSEFTGKHLCWSHFLIKLQAKRDSITSVFLWFFRNKNSLWLI